MWFSPANNTRKLTSVNMDPKAKPFTSSSAKGTTSNSGAHPSEVEWAAVNSVLDKNGGSKSNGGNSSGGNSSGGNSGGSSDRGGKVK